MVSAHAELPCKSERCLAPSATWHSERLDELTLEGEALRQALRTVPQGTSQAAQLSTDLVIVEAEKLSIEGALLL